MTIKVPDGWNEVSIGTFQELAESKDLIERVSILIDEDPDIVKCFDIHSLNKVAELIKWIDELPKQDEWKRNIEVNGKTYSFNDKLSSLSAGQWLDLEHYLLNPTQNLHKIIALFYKGDAEDFKSVSMADAYGCMLFFSSIESRFMLNMQVYLIHQLRKMNQPTQRITGSGSFMQWLKATRAKWQIYLS